MDRVIYYLLRLAMLPFRFMPYTWIHAIGRGLGHVGFYCLHTYRKRALSNLALANNLSLTRREIIRTAKQSFQNLAINCLEYSKFASEKSFAHVIQCENPEVADALYAKGQGIIFFCGHQSNWETLFLDGTSRMRGTAIGKPIKNRVLYQWILSIREKQGGKIVEPRHAIREGMRALKKGIFVGIVGDQGMPNSGYSFPFLGRKAWTSTAPALLAYRTNSPILFAETRRVRGGYRIRYSEPIWPNPSEPVELMMDKTLKLFEESVRRNPGEWLWQHNRWKQQTPRNVLKQFRHDAIAMILPMEQKPFEALLPHLLLLKQIYPSEFLALLVPEHFRNTPLIAADEIIYYHTLPETLRPDFRFKLIFNFTGYKPICKHYKRLSAFEVLNLDPLSDLSKRLRSTLCRPKSEFNAN